jgi:hypothetical protein
MLNSAFSVSSSTVKRYFDRVGLQICFIFEMHVEIVFAAPNRRAGSLVFR